MRASSMLTDSGGVRSTGTIDCVQCLGNIIVAQLHVTGRTVQVPTGCTSSSCVCENPTMRCTTEFTFHLR
jgi:hypothetical protein